MMDASELELTQSYIAEPTTLFTSSRATPRPFDTSLTNLNLSSRHVGTSSAQRNTDRYAVTAERFAKGDLMDISAIQQQIQEKIRVDHSFAAQQRDEESKIRFDLERSKVHLIEQYQLSEAKLLTELSDCKAHYEEQARVSEANWTEKLNQKQVEVDNLESKLRDLLDMSRKRIADKEKGIVEQLEQQERIWKQRIEEIEQAHDENLRGMQSKYLLEKDSHELAVKARMDAKEDQVRAQYDKKMKKYEAQLQEVMRNYHDKELIIHGSLDEARKEIVLMRSSFIAKEDTLREELASKDRIIITMQSKLHTVDDITKIADSWRSAANNLARMVVHACVSIQDVPPVPVPPKDLVPNIFQGLAKEEDVSKQKEAYNAELRAFHRLRKESVLVSKELISKTLRNSKRVMDRVRAETVPGFDFSINDNDQ